jgi:hypothetical protein
VYRSASAELSYGIAHSRQLGGLLDCRACFGGLFLSDITNVMVSTIINVLSCFAGSNVVVVASLPCLPPQGHPVGGLGLASRTGAICSPRSLGSSACLAYLRFVLLLCLFLGSAPSYAAGLPSPPPPCRLRSQLGYRLVARSGGFVSWRRGFPRYARLGRAALGGSVALSCSYYHFPP